MFHFIKYIYTQFLDHCAVSAYYLTLTVFAAIVNLGCSRYSDWLFWKRGLPNHDNEMRNLSATIGQHHILNICSCIQSENPTRVHNVITSTILKGGTCCQIDSLIPLESHLFIFHASIKGSHSLPPREPHIYDFREREFWVLRSQETDVCEGESWVMEWCLNREVFSGERNESRSSLQFTFFSREGNGKG